MKDNKILNLLKVIIIFVSYIFYTDIFHNIFSLMGYNNTITLFIADFIFFISIIFINKENLSVKFKRFKEGYSLKEKITVIIKWLLIILGVNILMGFVTEIFYPELANGIDENTSSVAKLFDISFIYSLFKTLLFAPIAEELVFKESIRNIVKNDIAFILISSIIYTIMNFIYATYSIQYLDILGYFIFSLILSFVYVKSNDNIVIVMIIKFFYNLLPTLLLFGTMMVGVNI